MLVGSLVKHFALGVEALGLLAVCTALAALISALVTASILTGHLRGVVGSPTDLAVDPEQLERLTGARIVSNDQLREIERHVKAPEIWVVTRDPEFDSSSSGGSFRPVVSENIHKKDTRYRYLVPESMGVAVANSLVGDLPHERLAVDRIPDNRWPELPLSSGAIIIYNPNADRAFDDCVAYFEYPVREPLCWGRVETRRAAEWADQIRRILVAPELAG